MKPCQAERFLAGMCITCNKNKTVGGRLRCQTCLDNRKGQCRTYYKQDRAKGICKECRGKIDEGGTKVVCSACRQLQNIRMRQYYADLRARTVAAYGGKCSCCGEQNIQFLCVDHINNDGNKHRKELGGKNFYSWLEKHGFPQDRFQLLCYNCNFGKQVNKGVCPHKGIHNG